MAQTSSGTELDKSPHRASGLRKHDDMKEEVHDRTSQKTDTGGELAVAGKEEMSSK